MGEALKKRLKMSHFEGPYHEAILGLMVASSEIRAKMDRTLASVGLTNEQFNILRILRGAKPAGHPCGEIGDRMVDRSPDITRRIDALEKQGFVTRERSTSDRRVVNVAITEKGLAALDQAVPLLESIEHEIRSRVSDEELDHLGRLCDHLVDLT